MIKKIGNKGSTTPPRKSPTKINGPALADNFALHYGVRVSRDSATDPYGVAHYLGILAQPDTSANRHRITCNRPVNQDAPENCYRVAGVPDTRIEHPIHTTSPADLVSVDAYV